MPGYEMFFGAKFTPLPAFWETALLVAAGAYAVMGFGVFLYVLYRDGSKNDMSSVNVAFGIVLTFLPIGFLIAIAAWPIVLAIYLMEVLPPVDEGPEKKQ